MTATPKHLPLLLEMTVITNVIKNGYTSAKSHQQILDSPYFQRSALTTDVTLCWQFASSLLPQIHRLVKDIIYIFVCIFAMGGGKFIKLLNVDIAL